MIPVNNSTMDVISETTNTINKLKSNWILWAHLPHENNWKLASYKKICTFTSIQDTMAISELLPDDLVKNCMLFIMKDGIAPMWEDSRNRTGGCFSYKVSNKNVVSVWRDLTYLLVGNTISSDNMFVNNVCGITISPKKNFCIVKIWTSKCTHQSPLIITDVRNLTPHGCLFKKHVPEY